MTSDRSELECLSRRQVAALLLREAADNLVPRKTPEITERLTTALRGIGARSLAERARDVAVRGRRARVKDGWRKLADLLDGAP